MLKQVVKSALASAPGWAAYSKLRTSGLVVLTYHRINPAGPDGALFPGLAADIFAEQVAWLSRRCRIVSATESVDCLQRPSGKVPVLLTFDDGYRDYHDIAYPILEAHKVPALVFVPTAFIGTGALIWTDHVVAGVTHTREQHVRLPWALDETVPLDTPRHRKDFIAVAKRRLKTLSDEDRQSQLAALMNALGIQEPEALVQRQMMTWDEVRATMPLTTYGGHSHAHSILSSMTAPALDADIRRCRQLLDENSAAGCRFFAYPNGQPADFDSQTQACLQRHGFDVVFTTIAGVNGVAANRMALRRQPTTARTVGDLAALLTQTGG